MEANEKANYTTEYIVGAGYLVFFFLLGIILCSALYYSIYLQSRSVPVINTFSTSLPPLTATPHILPTMQRNTSLIFKDDFSDDSHGWDDDDEALKAEVTLGKLLIRSKDHHSAYEGCGFCPTLETPFFLQADFSTGASTDKGFGIYFNYTSSNDNFFLFQINPEARKYYFYRYAKDHWTLRTAGETDLIHSFPKINTLGVYARNDTLEFYVNGTIIDSYKESGYVFHNGDFGFYVDDSDFQLVVDNLRISNIEN